MVDVLETLFLEEGLEEGLASKESLISTSRYGVLSNRPVPVEYIIYDVWGGMRQHDKDMATRFLRQFFLREIIDGQHAYEAYDI